MQDLGILNDLLLDETISEIMVNGTSDIFIERCGKIYPENISFANEKEIYDIIDKILKPLGKKINAADTPYVDARLEDGSRVNIIIPPVSLTGPMITIRKFLKKILNSDDLYASQTINENMIEFLKQSIVLKKNMIISGGTGSGKTTLLNILSSFIPSDERIITIEDTAELQLRQPHIGRLEAQQANMQGKDAVSIRQLVINSLRMRPDRIIVGECRGGEALDMLQAMNTGHQGSITTVHSNSPRDCLKRLEVMVMMANYDLPVKVIREQISSAINIIIQTERQYDGSRKVINISEITGMEGDVITMAPIFEFKNGFHKAAGVLPSFIEELKLNKVDSGLFYND